MAAERVSPFDSMRTFSGTHAAKIVGITYRQLDYWARTDLVRPSAHDASGSGSRREYVYRDLLELKVIKNLLDAGIKLESVRTVFNYLRRHVSTNVAAAHVVISGQSVVLCDGEHLIDAVRNGQGVLNVLPLANVKQELDASITNLKKKERDEYVASQQAHHSRLAKVAASTQTTRRIAR
jgi:DNA-binding transcriptional MerR regulator